MHPHCRYSNQTASNSQFFVYVPWFSKKHRNGQLQIDPDRFRMQKCVGGTVCHESSKYWQIPTKNACLWHSIEELPMEFPSFFHQHGPFYQKRIQSTNLSLEKKSKMSKPPWLPFIPFLKKQKKHTTFVYTKSCFMRPTRKIDWFQPQKNDSIVSPQLLRASPPFRKVGVPPFNQSPQPQVLPNAHRIHHRLSTSQ